MTRKEIFQWVKEQYGTEPDYPWKDQNAVLRHCENKKWYGLIMKVRSDRLGLQGEDMIDILNVKSDPMLVGVLRTQPGFLPAYHMNKDQWITVCLDGSVSEQEIKNLIDVSFHLTKSKNRQQNRTNICADFDQKFC